MNISRGSFRKILNTHSGNAEGLDPSFEYFDYTLLQIWVGKAKVSVGDITGSVLYGTVYGILNGVCPPNIKDAICNSDRIDHCFKTRTTVKGQVKEGKCKVLSIMRILLIKFRPDMHWWYPRRVEG